MNYYPSILAVAKETALMAVTTVPIQENSVEIDFSEEGLFEKIKSLLTKL